MLNTEIDKQYNIFNDPTAQSPCDQPFEVIPGAPWFMRKVVKANCRAKSKSWIIPASVMLHKESVKSWCKDNCVYKWKFQFVKQLSGSINLIFKQQGWLEQYGITIKVDDGYNVIKAYKIYKDGYSSKVKALGQTLINVYGKKNPVITFKQDKW